MTHRRFLRIVVIFDTGGEVTPLAGLRVLLLELRPATLDELPLVALLRRLIAPCPPTALPVSSLSSTRIQYADYPTINHARCPNSRQQNACVK
jgi:hypothetical protein